MEERILNQMNPRMGLARLGVTLSLFALLGGCSTVQELVSDISQPTQNRVEPISQPQLGPLAELQPLTISEDIGGNAVAPAQPSEDLWVRIRKGFAMAPADSRRTEQFIAFFASKPEYIARMTERSQKYLYYIVQAIDERNMPMELALLPFIESAFNPEASSRAKAAGMWQFMPATGRHFDLKQNVFRDERRDVLESTEAALDYLQSLYDMFGDWHLALAAYNWGQGNVKKAIRRNKARNKDTEYTDLRMPRETRSYVPQLMAFKAIVLDPQRYGIDLPAVPDHPFFDVVEITRDIDVKLAAELANISEAEFKSLNPSLQRPVILAAGLPRILLPWENAALFEANLEAHQGQLATWTAWRVPKTASTRQLAKMLGMPESELRAVNDIPKQRRVTAGSVLLVKRTKSLDKDASAKLADTAQISLRREVRYKRTTLQFKAGETVAQVAKRYRISAKSLAKLNKLSVNTRLSSSNRLIAWLPVKSNSQSSGKSIRVRRGDTLSGIAKRYGVSLRALMRTNNLDSRSIIRIGQRLRLP